MGVLEDILANILLNRVRYYKAEFFNSRLGVSQNLGLLLEVNRASAVLVNFFLGILCHNFVISHRFKPWSKIILLVQYIHDFNCNKVFSIFIFRDSHKLS